jgi:capsular polysaccharide biosynthesis protein
VEFRAYASTLIRHWAIILALAILAALAAYGYSARAPRVYRATAQLSVTPSIVDYFTGEAVRNLLNNYSLRLRSRLFAEQIAASAQPALPVEQVAGKVQAVASPSEYRIAIQVDDPDPALAQRIANAAANAFVATIRAENEGKDKHDVAVSVMERADLPGAPVSPRPKRDALGAGVLGALIGVGVAFLLEFWDDSVRGVDEAAGLFGWPVLGTIPEAPPVGRVPRGTLGLGRAPARLQHRFRPGR